MPASVPSRAFFGREDERRILEGWLASDSRAFAVVTGVAGIGKSALLARALANERRPKLLRRVSAHDDAPGILSSFADFLAHQNRRRLKAAITRPAYDPIEVIAVLREDLAGCVLAIDDLHACPAADALLRAVVEHPPEAKILVATRTQPGFFESPDVARGRVLELRLEGLDDESAAELLASRGASLEPADVPRVVAATGGHPLALELFAASGLDAGAVETERYVLDTVLEDLDDASEELLRTFAVFRRPARSRRTGVRGECAGGRPGGRLAPRAAGFEARLAPGGDADVPGKVRRGPGGPRADREDGDAGRTPSGAHPTRADRESTRLVPGREGDPGGSGPGGIRARRPGGRRGSAAGPRRCGAEARGPSGGDGAPGASGGPLAPRLARAGPDADRSRRRPDRARGPRPGEDASPRGRFIGPERHEGRRGDPDQPRDRLEPRRGRPHGGGNVRAVRGDRLGRRGRALRVVRPGERGRQFPPAGSGRGRGHECGARGSARGDDRRSGRPVDGQGEHGPRVREARRVDEGGGPSARVRRDDRATREPVLPGDPVRGDRAPLPDPGARRRRGPVGGRGPGTSPARS